MFNVMGSDVPSTVPVWRFNEDRTVTNVRPSCFFQEAKHLSQQHGQRGIIGYIVKNQFGELRPMTFLQATRLKDIIESGRIKIQDYLYAHNVPAEYGLTGFDTESTRVMTTR